MNENNIAQAYISKSKVDSTNQPKAHEHFSNLPLELWRLVYQYLPRSDLLHGALVSPTHSVSRFCQSQIWASLDADDWVFEGIYQGLARNAALVHRLICNPRAKLEVLAVPECQFITHLNIEQMRFLSSSILEKLLEYNARSLQSLHVRLDGTIFKMVVEKISKMTELKELYLQHWEGVHQEALEIALESCPWIEVLSLGYNSLYPFNLDNLKQNPTLSTKSPFKIRSLILDGTVIFHDELVLNLASRCPDLERLSMKGCFGIRLSSGFITSLAQFCPKLKALNLSNQSVTDDFYKTLFYVLPGLKDVRVAASIISDSDIQLLIQNSASTLETLDIGLCTSLESRSVLSILLGCTQLVHLSALGVDFNPREMDSADEWVCTSLESLYLEILLPKRSHYAAGEPERIRNKIYQQLSRLSNLRSLQLSGGSKDRGVNILEMSLLTGLSALSTLVKLERLDIKRLRHAVRSAEVSWMLKSWPRLKNLGVLLDTNADMELVRTVHMKNKDICIW
ncbi:Antagonist of MEN (Mitotic Exit Network) [Entomortierella lignicola]|nr:Antagonist of MEN (Mitotic Exit Network) [Entomortierella lignicola]